jgi:hypothetical protein
MLADTGFELCTAWDGLGRSAANARSTNQTIQRPDDPERSDGAEGITYRKDKTL